MDSRRLQEWWQARTERDAVDAVLRMAREEVTTRRETGRSNEGSDEEREQEDYE